MLNTPPPLVVMVKANRLTLRGPIHGLVEPTIRLMITYSPASTPRSTSAAATRRPSGRSATPAQEPGPARSRPTASACVPSGIPHRGLDGLARRRAEVRIVLALVPADDHPASSCPASHNRRSGRRAKTARRRTADQQEGRITKTPPPDIRIAREYKNFDISGTTANLANHSFRCASRNAAECRSQAPRPLSSARGRCAGRSPDTGYRSSEIPQKRPRVVAPLKALPGRESCCLGFQHSGRGSA
jgi:hypothetical protein